MAEMFLVQERPDLKATLIATNDRYCYCPACGAEVNTAVAEDRVALRSIRHNSPVKEVLINEGYLLCGKCGEHIPFSRLWDQEKKTAPYIPLINSKADNKNVEVEQEKTPLALTLLLCHDHNYP